MEGLGNVVDGWNGVRKFLGALRTQNQSWEIDGFAQKSWRSLLQDVQIHYNSLNDQENQIQIGWDNFFY